ncbi:hypothetical protein VF21_06299 [Pseudogymnoascus sp. 05NY08]|nr:hypothetical protein VF21_06299 [Pseudogymnoascus sp. 05NY08]
MSSPLNNTNPNLEKHTEALKNSLTITKPGGTISQPEADNGWNGGAGFSGYTSLALFAKWQKLSRTPDDAAKIINLIWTDVSANTVVGTKAWGLTSAAAVTKAAKVPFAVPGFLVLWLVVAVPTALIMLLVLGRAGPKRMRRSLEDIYVGRAMGVLLWPEKKRRLGTEEWVESVGARRVKIRREGVRKEDRKSGEGGEVRKRVVVAVVDVGELGHGENGKNGKNDV